MSLICARITIANRKFAGLRSDGSERGKKCLTLCPNKGNFVNQSNRSGYGIARDMERSEKRGK